MLTRRLYLDCRSHPSVRLVIASCDVGSGVWCQRRHPRVPDSLGGYYYTTVITILYLGGNKYTRFEGLAV
jgi:hypothetical protein